MKVDVVQLPSQIDPDALSDCVAVVFDVLRATTTIVTALSAGASEVRVFDTLDAARRACSNFYGTRLLCGEVACLPPPGFDLGNSPGAFTPEVCSGRTIFLATTNGTRALVAAKGAHQLFVASLLNARSIARVLTRLDCDTLLIASGTDGEIAEEDLIGAGAVIDAIGDVHLDSHAAHNALELFRAAKTDLASALRRAQGGKNLVRVRLDSDIDFAAKLDALDLVAVVDREALAVRRASDLQ